MKSKISFILLLLIGTLSTSCYKDTIRVAGEVTREEVTISGFTGVKVSDAFHVFISFSETEEHIVIEANADVQEYIIAEKRQNNLIVRLKNYTNIKGNATLNVFITTRDLTYFSASGASNITLENPLVVRDAEIDLSGASTFYGEMNVSRLRLDSHGASNSDLFGSAGRLEASLSGSSELRNLDFRVQNLDIKLSGASDAMLSITESIYIDASGASSLTYTGDAIIERKQLTGSSQIIKK